MNEDHPLSQSLKTGDVASQFELANTDGELFNLAKTTQEQPIAVLFYRGDW